MAAALLAARLVLAAVFAVAAAGKLADLEGSRRALAGFGVPSRLARPLGVLLPVAELAVALALLPAATARAAVIAAGALLVLFVVAISAGMIRGESPDCHCFGRIHSSPAGWSTLVRNGGLGALALFVALGADRGAGPSGIAWISRLSPAGAVAVGAALAFLLLGAGVAFMQLGLVRQNGRLLLRVEELERRLEHTSPLPPADPATTAAGLPVGTPAPSFHLGGLYGETVTLELLTAAELPVVLLFTDPSCGPCNALLPQIAGWQREHVGALTISVVTRGSADDSRAETREHGVGSVWLDADLAVADAYRVEGAPSAVLLDAHGTILSRLAEGAAEIAALVQRALANPGPPRASRRDPGERSDSLA
jgi:thiol-disulfide isomerase/thioredoxin